MSETLTSQGPWMETQVFDSIMQSSSSLSSSQRRAKFVQVVQRSPLVLSDTQCRMKCRMIPSSVDENMPEWIKSGTIVQLKDYQIQGSTSSSGTLELYLTTATPLELVGGISSGIVGDLVDIQRTIPVRRVLQSCAPTELLQRLERANHNSHSSSSNTSSSSPTKQSLAQILLDGEEADDESGGPDEDDEEEDDINPLEPETQDLRPVRQELFQATPNLGVETLLQDKTKLLQVLDDDDEDEAEENGRTMEALLKDKTKLLEVLNDDDDEKQDKMIALNDENEEVNPSTLLKEDILKSSDDEGRPQKFRRSTRLRKRVLSIGEESEQEESLVASRQDFDHEQENGEAANNLMNQQKPSIFRKTSNEDTNNKRRRTLAMREEGQVLSKDDDHSLSEKDGQELEQSLSRISEEDSQSGSSEPIVGISDVLIDSSQTQIGRNLIINRLPSDDNPIRVVNTIPVDELTTNYRKALVNTTTANEITESNETGTLEPSSFQRKTTPPQQQLASPQRPNSLSVLTPRQSSVGTAVADNSSLTPKLTDNTDFQTKFEKVQLFYLQIWEQRNAKTFKIVS
mmetsp:Transcript_27226/g.40198  ORF Transcript_27226/g.40198 Transcript_27226/m.40198 type:complete len:571 (+) Transcript_27226:132-1844(+)